jgi:hypothetical protein
MYPYYSNIDRNNEKYAQAISGNPIFYRKEMSCGHPSAKLYTYLYH